LGILSPDQSFPKAVRNRRPENLTANMDAGVTSTALASLANITYRPGLRLSFSPDGLKFPADSEATRLAAPNHSQHFSVRRSV
jgi:hypothetical protein